eukprot:6483456-Amphidinium_carterae.1
MLAETRTIRPTSSSRLSFRKDHHSVSPHSHMTSSLTQQLAARSSLIDSKTLRFQDQEDGKEKIEPQTTQCSTGQPKDEPVEEVHLLLSAKERATQKKQILDEVEQTLVEHHVRAAPTRTNIYGQNVSGHDFSPGSALYGVYTRRGKGITKITAEKPEILR